VYCYFPSKFEVFVATLRQGLIEVHDLTAKNVATAKNTAGKVRAFLRTRLEYSEQNREFYRIYFTEFSNMVFQPSPIREEFQDLYHRQAHVLEAILLDGMSQGEIRTINALRTAYMIYEATRSAIAHRILGWDDRPVEQTEKTLFEFIWKGVES